MNKLKYTILFSFTIWVMASLINAVLFIMVNYLLAGNRSLFAEIALISLVFSFAFSLPGIFIFWFIFFACYYKHALFQILLKAALFTSFFSGLVVCNFFYAALDWHAALLLLNAVVAAITALCMHRSLILKKCKNEVYV